MLIFVVLLLLENKNITTSLGATVPERQSLTQRETVRGSDRQAVKNTHTYMCTHTHCMHRSHTHTLPCPALYLGARKQVGEGSPKHFDDHVQIPQVLCFLHDEVLHNLLIGHGLSPDGLILDHHRRHILFLREHVYQHLGGRESRRRFSCRSFKVIQLQSNRSGIITVAYIYKVRRRFSRRSLKVIQTAVE